MKTTDTAEKLRAAIGAKIKAIREKKGMSQATLGDAIHSSDKYVSKVEHGRTNIGVDKLLEIGNALNTPLRSFFK